MNEFVSRLERLCAQLPEGADGALVTSQVSRFYLTGYYADTGYLVVTKNGSAFITDSRYIEAAAAKLEGVCRAVCYSKLDETLSAVCAELGAKALLIENERVTLAESVSLAKAAEPVALLTTHQLDDILGSMRISKTIGELGQIRAAQELTEHCFRRILEKVREGVTERELALELEFDMRRQGAERVAFELIIAAGANGSMPHAVPSDNRVKRGDFITFDIGAVVNGYHSDMTRTVSLGAVSDEQMRIYETVRAAQAKSIQYLMNGGDSGFEADKAARDVIAAAGYGEYFGHSTGHGVGVEIHEAPNLAPRSKAMLTEGNVVTVEPGIYLPGQFGVRIEDMLYITGGSAIDLTNIERELIVID